MKTIVVTILTVFALSAQANYASKGHNWNAGSPDSAKTAISAARAVYKAALQDNMAWRDTEKMIKEARKLQKAGKMKAATELANKAYVQAVNAREQAAIARSAGPRF